MEKELYFGYALKEGTDVTNAISKIKELAIKLYKQELEKSVAEVVVKITNRKIAGCDEKKIKEALNTMDISYNFNEKLSNIYKKLSIFQKEKIDDCSITLYQLSSGKTLFTTDFDCFIDSKLAYLLGNSIESLEFVKCHTNDQKIVDEIISESDLIICTNDWEEVDSLSKDKIKIIKLLDAENLTTVNLNNVENIIKNDTENRLKGISYLKLHDMFEIEKKEINERLQFLISEDYHKALDIQIEKERLNLTENITLNIESTVNDLLIQC